MHGKTLLNRLGAEAAQVFETLYGAEGVEPARRRYLGLIEGMLRDFPETAENIRLFTAAGRTELGGNHTDHNRGKVVAASIQLDSAAAAAPQKDMNVLFRSTGYPDVKVNLTDLSPQPGERGTTEALVRGIAAEFTRRGTPVKGFIANADSTVLPGSGLSSSAAVEVLFGRIFDSLYSDGSRSALEIAQIGQKAENEYFGKPCGLMDQTASASGGAVVIDFADTANPQVTRIEFDPAAAGYALCVVDTKGSHADLTDDYASIPGEMKAVARFFNREALRDVQPEDLVTHASEIRKTAGDRALLRSIHFFEENRRVDAMRAALETAAQAQLPQKKAEALADYLKLVNESGDSSWELLQNIYAPRHPDVQGISVALALTRKFLQGTGACRVHGGGFAGTIQVYLRQEQVGAYQGYMERVFGPRSVTVLRIRPIGAAELHF
jgi:galactokinase